MSHGAPRSRVRSAMGHQALSKTCAPKTASRRPFDVAIAEFAAAYADLNERDHKALVQSIADGKIAAVGGV
jgi:hypothetical protein